MELSALLPIRAATNWRNSAFLFRGRTAPTHLSQGTDAMNRRESLKLLAGSAALAATGGLFLPQIALAQAPGRRAVQTAPARLRIRGARAAYRRADHDAASRQAPRRLCGRNATSSPRPVPELGTTPIEKTLVDPAYVPLQIQKQVKDNLGGHWNHTFFWQLMTPGGAKQPGGELKTAIEPSTATSRSSRNGFNEAGAARFGAGWAWLIVNKNKKLEITIDGEPGYAGRGRRARGARRRCLGARLLPEVSEPPRRTISRPGGTR